MWHPYLFFVWILAVECQNAVPKGVCQADINELFGKEESFKNIRRHNFQPLFFCANVPNGWLPMEPPKPKPKGGLHVLRQFVNAQLARYEAQQNAKTLEERWALILKTSWGWKAEQVERLGELRKTKVELDYLTPGRDHWLQDPTFMNWGFRARDPYAFIQAYDYWPDVDKNYFKVNGVDMTRKASREKHVNIIYKENARLRFDTENAGLYFKVEASGIGTRDRRGAVATVLKGWYHLKITLADEEGKSVNPKGYWIDRLMISGRGVHSINRPNDVVSYTPQQLLGVTGGVGHFVVDFPRCKYKGGMVPDMNFIPEQELPCGGGNGWSSQVGNNFIYVRSTHERWGTPEARPEIHVNFKLPHSFCDFWYEVDWVVVGIVVEHDIAVENVRNPDNRDRIWYVERSKSTRFHFLSPKAKTDPIFFNQPDPIPTTLSPDELDCSIDLKGVEDAPNQAESAETFLGAIKHIQDANQKNVAPEDPDFNPITVMYYNLYGHLDRASKEVAPEYLYNSYFPKGQAYQCQHKDSVLNDVEKGIRQPPVPYDPKHRQLLDFSTGIPYLDFTCIGRGGHYTVLNRLETRQDGGIGGFQLIQNGDENTLSVEEINKITFAEAYSWIKYLDADQPEFSGICTPVSQNSKQGLMDLKHSPCVGAFSTSNLTGFNMRHRAFHLSKESRPNLVKLVDKYKRDLWYGQRHWFNYYLNPEGTRQTLYKAICESQRRLNNQKCPTIGPKPFVITAKQRKGGPAPTTTSTTTTTTTTTTTKPPSTIFDPNATHVTAVTETGIEVTDNIDDIDYEEVKVGGNLRQKFFQQKIDKRIRRKPTNGDFVPRREKGKDFGDDITMWIWDSRVLHGVLFIFLTTFLTPINIFVTRHFKETFMDKKIYYFHIWFFIHIMMALVMPFIYIAGLMRQVDTRSIVGVNLGKVAFWHRNIGWACFGLTVCMVLFGAFRTMHKQVRWTLVGVHWFLGMLIYILLLTCAFSSIWIPGSPAAYLDVSYLRRSAANLKFEAVFFMLVLWVVFDIMMHVILTFHTCREDKKLLLPKGRLYLPPPIPVMNEDAKYDAPGSGFRRRMLFVYVAVSFLVTATIITMLFSYSPRRRGLGYMSCTHAGPNAADLFPEYKC